MFILNFIFSVQIYAKCHTIYFGTCTQLYTIVNYCTLVHNSRLLYPTVHSCPAGAPAEYNLRLWAGEKKTAAQVS